MTEKPSSIHEFSATTIDGRSKSLGEYRGRVMLIVNVASECGLTPQYHGLEQLHEEYASRGLSVLAFPANEFGAQEPGTNEQIREFCSTRYGVKFDLFAKIKVKGAGTHPLYQYLTASEKNPRFAGDIKWNFTKFLVGRDGQLLARFEPAVEPTSADVRGAVETALS